MIPLMVAMKIDELKNFVEAINMARFGHEQASAFDKQVENENAKLPYGN